MGHNPGIPLDGLRETKKTLVSVIGVPDENRTKHFVNTSKEHYCLSRVSQCRLTLVGTFVLVTIVFGSRIENIK
jgi:hypothetical protein